MYIYKQERELAQRRQESVEMTAEMQLEQARRREESLGVLRLLQDEQASDVMRERTAELARRREESLGVLRLLKDAADTATPHMQALTPDRHTRDGRLDAPRLREGDALPLPTDGGHTGAVADTLTVANA